MRLHLQWTQQSCVCVHNSPHSINEFYVLRKTSTQVKREGERKHSRTAHTTIIFPLNTSDASLKYHISSGWWCCDALQFSAIKCPGKNVPAARVISVMWSILWVWSISQSFIKLNLMLCCNKISVHHFHMHAEKGQKPGADRGRNNKMDQSKSVEFSWWISWMWNVKFKHLIEFFVWTHKNTSAS